VTSAVEWALGIGASVIGSLSVIAVVAIWKHSNTDAATRQHIDERDRQHDKDIADLKEYIKDGLASIHLQIDRGILPRTEERLNAHEERIESVEERLRSGRT
jgi:hypothetical protein